MPYLFGKQYDWDLVKGQLWLVKHWELPVVPDGPLTFDRLLEEVGGEMPWSDWGHVTTEVQRYASGES